MENTQNIVDQYVNELKNELYEITNKQGTSTLKIGDGSLAIYRILSRLRKDILGRKTVFEKTEFDAHLFLSCEGINTECISIEIAGDAIKVIDVRGSEINIFKSPNHLVSITRLKQRH